jgi:hypothetical protein
VSGGRGGPGHRAHGMGGGQVEDHALWMGGPGVTWCRACSMGEHGSHDVTAVGWEGHGWASRPLDSDGRAWGVRGVALVGWEGPQSGVTPVGWEGVA